jgi:hypothetical protein
VNGDALKAATSVLQGLVIMGGVAAAVYEFVLSGKTEERERVRNTIPFLEKAGSPEFREARARFDEIYYVLMSASMAGNDLKSPDYRDVHALRTLELKAGQVLSRQGSFYETVSQCLAASICSERAARHTLCLDATQLQDDLGLLKVGVSQLYAMHKHQLLAPHAEDQKRMYRALRGIETFAAGCHAWNKERPGDPVPVSDGPRRAPL